jgi:hypothetical protein
VVRILKAYNILKKDIDILGGEIFLSARCELVDKLRNNGLTVKIERTENTNRCIINVMEDDKNKLDRLLMEFINAGS